jgi:protein-disulfide isomerase
MTRRRIGTLATAAIAITAGALAFALWRPGKPSPRPAPVPAIPSVRFAVPSEGSPRTGAADALVTIVEFGDFQCEHTRAAAPVLKRLLAAHPDELALVWKDAPLVLHAGARMDALFARTARATLGVAGFWKAHDLLLQRQRFDAGSLQSAADQLGMKDFHLANLLGPGSMDDDHGIEADLAVARALGATSTPFFFVNGRRLAGAQSYEVFERLVAEELARARGLVRDGVAQSEVYSKLMASAEHVQIQTPPPPADRERERAAERHARLIEAMSHSEAFKLDDATIAELSKRGVRPEDVYEYIAARRRVRPFLGEDVPDRDEEAEEAAPPAAR